MITWMLYVVVVSSIIALAGRAAESLGRVVGYPVRWMWIGSLAVTTLLIVSSGVERGRAPIAHETLRAATPADQVLRQGAAWRVSLAAVIDEASQLLNRPLRAVAAAADDVSPSHATRYALFGWGVSTLVLALLFGVVVRRLQRARVSWPRARIHEVAVRIAPRVGPIVLGVLRPEIVVPRWLFGRGVDEQRLVIVHEREHLLARDPLLLALGWLVVIIAPWNLASWYMVSRLRLAIELDCDARVLSCGAEPQVYGSLLIDVAQHASPLGLSALGLADDGSQLHQRILALRRGRAPLASVRAAMSLAAAIAALVVAGSVSPPRHVAVRSQVAREPASTPASKAILTTKLGFAAVVPAAAAVPTPLQASFPEGRLRRRRTPVSDTAIARGVDVARTSLPHDSTTGVDDPLVFIDGVRSTLAAVHSTLDRSRISNVEVLKGAAAIAEYGDDARRGVITITTTAPPP